MDHLTMAMHHSSLAVKKPDWSFDKIVQSFPTEICDMIAERRRLPNTRPVLVTLNSHCLKAFMSILDGCNTPPGIRNTLRKAYHQNTTFQLPIGSMVRTARPALRLFLDQVGDNVRDLRTFRVQHTYFTVVIEMTPKKAGASIECHLESCRPERGDENLFAYVAERMLGDAKSLIESEMAANGQNGLSRQQLEQLVKTVCKVEIARRMIQHSWICTLEDEVLDSRVLPDDGLLQEYVAYMMESSGFDLDPQSKDPWIFQ